LGILDERDLAELARLKFLKSLTLAVKDTNEAAARRLQSLMPGTEVGRLNF